MKDREIRTREWREPAWTKRRRALEGAWNALAFLIAVGVVAVALRMIWGAW